MKPPLRTALALLLATALPLTAQDRPGWVTGVVYDSTLSAPLAGATAFLWGTEHMDVTDADGRFRIEGVPAGEYDLSFVHPRLEALGLAPIARPVRVEAGIEARAAVAIPSPATIRHVICGREAGSGGVLVGVVRDERTGTPVAGAQVTAAWRTTDYPEMALAETDAAGRYALCGLPLDTRLSLWVSRDDQRTGNDFIRLAESMFEQKDFRIDLRTVVRVIGLVVDAESREPLADALVHIGDKAVFTGTDGRFRLDGLDTGPQRMRASLVGYTPVEDTLVVALGTQDVAIRLAPDVIELDPITVTVLSQKLEGQGFFHRMESGRGTFFTREEIALQRAFHATDLLRATPGVTIRSTSDRNRYEVLLRGGCRPTYYVNGIPQTQGAFGLNDVGPEDLEALEVYASTAEVPPRFRTQTFARDAAGIVSSCSGAVVIWLR